MAKYVLIGGGETRKDKGYETGEIDSEIVKLVKKDKKNFLFIGLANNFSDSYYDAMKNIYKKLGCDCSYLKKKNILNNFEIAEKKIRDADIIYIGGGDSIKLLNEVRQYGLDKLLLNLKSDVVVAGMSAGAIMLANKGYSDSLILRGEDESFSFVSGLGFVDVNICPHYNKSERRESLKQDLTRVKEKVLGLENGVALIVDGEEKYLICSIKKAKGYLCYWKNEEYIEEVYYGLD